MSKKKIELSFSKSNKQSLQNPSRVRRLLERINSPLLDIASNLPLTPSPLDPSSPLTKRLGQEIELLSSGRLTLADKVFTNSDVYNEHQRVRLYHHSCSNYFWLSPSSLKAFGGNPDQACPHCNPMDIKNLEILGGKTEIQRFVLQQSHQATFFKCNNVIASVTDIYDFFCLRCQITYETPLVMFLRFSGDTNSCPSCELKEKQQWNQ